MQYTVQYTQKVNNKKKFSGPNFSNIFLLLL